MASNADPTHGNGSTASATTVGERTRITLLRGTDTIGGNLILVDYGRDRIVFDFGCVYDPAAGETPRDLQGLVASGVVPYLSGVFDRDVPVPGHEWRDDHDHVAVFVSHAHLDHSAMINLIDPAVPLYMMEDTRRLVRAMNAFGGFCLPAGARHDGWDHTRPIIGVPAGGRVTVGSIRVTLMPVDHDAYGAAGFRIDTPDTSIAYTGDLRFHGWHGGDSMAFLAASRGVDMLIMEGVSISFREPGEPAVEPETSEADVLRELVGLIEANPGRQITFDYYPTDVERVRHLIAFSPRRIVLTARAAGVLAAVTGEQAYHYRLPGERTADTLDPGMEVDIERLIADRHDYCWQLDARAQDLVFDRLAAGGLHLHTGALPLGDFDPAYEPFMQRFADRGIQPYDVNCSGHAYVEQAAGIIDMVRPRTLIPVHGERPDRYHNPYGRTVIPRPGMIVEP